MRVTLPRLVPAKELLEAVKRVSERTPGYCFHSERSFRDEEGEVYLIGQATASGHLLISVMPDENDPYVLLSEDYDFVTLRYRGPRIPQEDEVATLREFVEALKAYLSAQVKAEELPAWPRALEVCAICEQTLVNGGGVSRCPTHGEKAPSRTRYVVPVREA